MTAPQHASRHEVVAVIQAAVYVTVKDGEVSKVLILPDQTPVKADDIREVKVFTADSDAFFEARTEALEALNGAAWEPLYALPEGVEWEG